MNGNNNIKNVAQPVDASPAHGQDRESVQGWKKIIDGVNFRSVPGPRKHYIAKHYITDDTWLQIEMIEEEGYAKLTEDGWEICSDEEDADGLAFQLFASLCDETGCEEIIDELDDFYIVEDFDGMTIYSDWEDFSHLLAEELADRISQEVE